MCCVLFSHRRALVWLDLCARRGKMASDDDVVKMSRLLKLAQKFNCFYLKGKLCSPAPVPPPFERADTSSLPCAIKIDSIGYLCAYNAFYVLMMVGTCAIPIYALLIARTLRASGAGCVM